jgi:uncharacterized protein
MVPLDRVHWRERLSDVCFRRPVVVYVVLTYALTWAFTIPFVYLWRGPLEGNFEWWLIFFLPGAYGPTMAALIMAGILEGRPGVKHLLGRLLIWRAHWGWYLFALLTPLATLTTAVCVSSFRDAAWAAFAPGELVLSIPLAMLVALPFGPLAEELGWRGFALPELQRQYSALTSSLILGCVWTFWHTPMFWFPGAAIPSFLDVSGFSLALYLANITAISILLTTMFNNTAGSVPLAILLHTTFNAARNSLFAALPEPSQHQKVEIYVLNILILSAVAIVTQRLLRGSPGREPETVKEKAVRWAP